MALWVFIGAAFGIVLLIGCLIDRRRINRGLSLKEDNQRADNVAADAARAAAARMSPTSGGFGL